MMETYKRLQSVAEAISLSERGVWFGRIRRQTSIVRCVQLAADRRHRRHLRIMHITDYIFFIFIRSNYSQKISEATSDSEQQQLLQRSLSFGLNACCISTAEDCLFFNYRACKLFNTHISATLCFNYFR